MFFYKVVSLVSLKLISNIRVYALFLRIAELHPLVSIEKPTELKYCMSMKPSECKGLYFVLLFFFFVLR